MEYTHSSGNDTWADGTERTANNTTSTDISEARVDDNLTIGGGDVFAYNQSNSRNIGVLKSGTMGAGRFTIFTNSEITSGTIGKIIKQGNKAVDLRV